MKQYPEELCTNEKPWGEMSVELKEAFAVAVMAHGAKWCFWKERHLRWSGIQKYMPMPHPVIIYRLYREPISRADPPWNVLPEWINHVAMDKAGRWYGHAKKPKPSMMHGVWVSHFRKLMQPDDYRFPRGNAPWDQSLVSKVGFE